MYACICNGTQFRVYKNWPKGKSGHNHEITHPTADPAQCSFALIKLSDGKWLPSLHLMFMLLVLADYSGAVFYA